MGDIEEPVIRSGGLADAESVLALWRAAENPPSATDSVAGLRALLQRDPESLLLAELGGELVGSLIAGWDGWRGSFYRLAVHPGRRRQGVGRALIRAGEERLKGLGAIRLTAIVISEEAAATALREQSGYRRQEGMSRFVRIVGPMPGRT
jgi:ribosomal protein S18 acetylase RimI-like enzyme